MALHEVRLVLQLLRDVVRRRAADLDPRLGEQRARGEHEGGVEDGVQGVGRDVLEGVRRREVEHEAAAGGHVVAHPAHARCQMMMMMIAANPM